MQADEIVRRMGTALFDRQLGKATPLFGDRILELQCKATMAGGRWVHGEWA